MKPAYLSQQWAEAALLAVESDARVQAAVRGLELSILILVINPPPGTYGFVYLEYDGKGLRDYRAGHDYRSVTAGIAAPTFVVSGEYEVFAQVQRGHLSERRAIVTGRLHLTGSLLRALRHMRALEAVTRVLREVPCQV